MSSPGGSPPRGTGPVGLRARWDGIVGLSQKIRVAARCMSRPPGACISPLVLEFSYAFLSSRTYVWWCHPPDLEGIVGTDAVFLTDTDHLRYIWARLRAGRVSALLNHHDVLDHGFADFYQAVGMLA